MIQLNQVTFTGYTDNNQKTNMYFDLSINQGERAAIIGASGSGKSTLLNLIAGFIFADSGNIILNQKNHTNTKPFQRPVSMLFQDNNLFNHLTVADNIGLGLQPRLKFNTQQQQQIIQTAQQVGLTDFLNKTPNQLSGGQKQRIAIARCLLRQQPILLLDEPFSALDKALRLEMIQLLKQLCTQKNLTLLLVTHQPEEVQDLVNKTICIENGQIVDIQ